MKPLLLCGLMTVALVLPTTAAANPISGELKRGDGDTALRAELRNDGSTANDFLRLKLASGTVVDAVTTPGCTPAGDQVQCDLGDRFAGGATFVIDFRTRARYPAGAGGDVFVCPRPCSGRDAGPFRIPGPSDTLASADLHAQVLMRPIDRAGGLRFFSGEDIVGTRVVGHITNFGPTVAESVSVVIDIPEAPAGVKVEAERPCFVQRGVRVPPSTVCDIGALPPGSSKDVIVHVTGNGTGQLRGEATVSSTTPDPGPAANSAFLVTNFREMNSFFEQFGFDRFEGRAVGADHVDLAILRQVGGAQPYAPSCLWLTRRGTFRRERGRRCDQPVWLRARGTRRWRLRLPGRLPRGRYTVFSRAVSGAVGEAGFVRGENRREFIIRRRR